jgi:hypothetical protein
MSTLEKLKAKWAKKLLDSGFKDIENKDGSLKAEIDMRTITKAMKDGTQEYYAQAEYFLNTHRFLSSLEFEVWIAHCDGNSYRKIAEHFELTFYKVRTIITKLQKLAGLRK